MLDMWFEILVGFAVLIGLGYTFLRALTAVQKEDIARLSADIREVKGEVKEVKDDVKEVKTELKADVRELNTKFDRYLFGKLEKTDDADKDDKGK